MPRIEADSWLSIDRRQGAVSGNGLIATEGLENIGKATLYVAAAGCMCQCRLEWTATPGTLGGDGSYWRSVANDGRLRVRGDQRGRKGCNQRARESQWPPRTRVYETQQVGGSPALCTYTTSRTSGETLTANWTRLYMPNTDALFCSE